MKTILITLLISTCSLMCYSQQSLDDKNGFKNIKLGDTITSIPKSILKNLETEQSNKDPELHYDITDNSYFKIGDDIKLNSVMITTFRGRIMTISLFFDKSYGDNMFKLFKEAYGDPSRRPNQFMDSYWWLSKKVIMNLDFDGSTELPHAMMSSREVFERSTAFKNQQIKKAASDL